MIMIRLILTGLIAFVFMEGGLFLGSALINSTWGLLVGQVVGGLVGIFLAWLFYEITSF